jgi:hypothetical protein
MPKFRHHIKDLMIVNVVLAVALGLAMGAVIVSGPLE